MPRGRHAHAHRRTGEGIPPSPARAGGEDAVGLAALPAVWRDADLQVGELPPPPAAARRAPAVAGPAAPLRTVFPGRRPARHVRRAVAVAPAGELVRPRGPSLRDRSLAEPGHQ